MKLVDAGTKVYKRGVQRAKSYRVAQTSKVMDMFSNMLYSDKIRAVIRELSTNAWDAHKMAGNTKKVPVIHLPTHAKPEFSIRDYGTGLSPEDLENMYLTYGESNKTDSNDFNGCMGIGSKSPFAYCSQFTTTSYYNGRKYIYINAKDDRGIPSLQLFHEEPTDEPNGLEISFACDPSDCYEFEEKGKSVLKWFPKPFKVYNGKSLVKIVNDNKYILEGDGWKIRNGENQSYVIMGYVEYPIEFKHFGSRKERENDWYSYYSDNDYVIFLKSGLELHVDIGDVDMDISREALQYNDHTIKSIKSAINKVKNDLAKIAEGSISNAKNYWEACKAYSSFRQNTAIQSVFNSVNVKFNGREVKRSIKAKSDKYNLVMFRKGYNTKPERTNNVQSIRANNNVHFMLADMKRGNFVAVERYLFNDKANFSYHTTVILICATDGVDIQTAKQAFIKDVGCDKSDVLLCSDVPKPPKQKRKKSAHVYELDMSANTNVYYANKSVDRSCWQEADIDFANGGIYVEVNNWMCVPEDSKKLAIRSINLLRTLKNLQTLGVDIPSIYGVKTAVVKKYRKHKKWKSVFEWISEQVSTIMNDEGLLTDVAMIDVLDKHDFKYRVLSSIFTYATEKTKPGNLAKKLLDKCDSVHKLKKDSDIDVVAKRTALSLIKSELSLKPQQPKKAQEFSQFFDEVWKRYEILSLIGDWRVRSAESANIVVRTMNLIDERTK